MEINIIVSVISLLNSRELLIDWKNDGLARIEKSRKTNKNFSFRRRFSLFSLSDSQHGFTEPRDSSLSQISMNTTVGRITKSSQNSILENSISKRLHQNHQRLDYNTQQSKKGIQWYGHNHLTNDRFQYRTKSTKSLKENIESTKECNHNEKSLNEN